MWFHIQTNFHSVVNKCTSVSDHRSAFTHFTSFCHPWVIWWSPKMHVDAKQKGVVVPVCVSASDVLCSCHFRNSKALGKLSGDSWRPIPWCWTSMASNCWIRAGMLLGLLTGRSASSTLMSKHTQIHKHIVQKLRGVKIAARMCVNLWLRCQFLLSGPLARQLF